MNLIHKLQKRLAENGAEILALREGLRDIKQYLQSEKFGTDNSVQAADILLRIREIENAANDAPEAVEFKPKHGKPTLRTNIYGNIKAYLGAVKVADFGTNEIDAQEWLRYMSGFPLTYPNSQDFKSYVTDKSTLEL